MLIATPWQQKMTLTLSDEQAIVFEARRRDLPQPIPSSWLIEDLADKKVKVTISAELDIKHDSTRDNPIKAGWAITRQALILPVCITVVTKPRGLQAHHFCGNGCNSLNLALIGNRS